jgi:hypothetical protein
MAVALLIVVVIGALSIIVSGIWVAIVLIRALSAPRVKPDTQSHANGRTGSLDN